MPKDEEKNGITVKKEEDMPEWYQQVCLKSELVDFGSVKGTMVIRPNGYSIWQAIQDYFNKNIVEASGARNAYFPIFVPESAFKKEAEHAEGFKPEVAWIDREVTGEGERLAIRPTSETIMYPSYAQWIRSYRDLPLKINQWCNVVRWETEATKLFLRSREFLWQEGHCVYETKKDCDEDTLNYIMLYQKLCKDLLAVPALVGRKTDKEKFAGAEYSTTIEAFMPDGKALQCGTSHMLGQGFAKAFGIRFIGKDEKEHIPFQNSWGLSTRLIGAIVMTHSDDKGLVLPPKVAFNKAVIVPIIIGETKDKIMAKCAEVKALLKDFNPILDDREGYTPGWKYNEWEMKGMPVRLEIGPRDADKDQVVLVRRDTGSKDFVKISELPKRLEKALNDIHENLYEKAEKHLKKSIVNCKDWGDAVKAIREKKMAKMPFCGEGDCENWVKEKTGGASSRCCSLDEKVPETSQCLHCKKPAKFITYFSKGY